MKGLRSPRVDQTYTVVGRQRRGDDRVKLQLTLDNDLPFTNVFFSEQVRRVASPRRRRTLRVCHESDSSYPMGPWKNEHERQPASLAVGVAPKDLADQSSALHCFHVTQ